MEKYFTLVEDEFSNNNEIWYRPKSAHNIQTKCSFAIFKQKRIPKI